MSSPEETDLDMDEYLHYPSDDSSSMAASSTMTFTESLAACWFTERHGRKVQASNASYRWPSDDLAQVAEEYSSDWKIARFGLYPLEVASRVEDRLSKPGARVLDVGQGMSGVWLISMADKFPNAECTGVDTQPLTSTCVPSNITTELFDVSVGLPYPDCFFDVIHHSALATGFSEEFTFENLCNEIARCLKPDGVYSFLEALRWIPFTEKGDPLEKRFPAGDRLRRAHASMAPNSTAPYCLSTAPDDTPFFTSVLRASNCFDSFDVSTHFTQAGGRGVDPEADLIGELYRLHAIHACTPYFLLAAGSSEEEAERWKIEMRDEMERMKLCESGEGLVGRHSLGWAVRKDH